MRCFNMVLRLAMALGVAAVARAEGLERLKYNHPDLVVDLGVGLWAWPLPMDLDSDGDFDLVVSCADKPYNGTYVFENAKGDTTKEPFPIFKPARCISQGAENVHVSFVDGQARVLMPAMEFPDFRKTGLARPTRWSMPADVHTTTKPPRPIAPIRLRGNSWRYADYDGDGAVDLTIGVGEWPPFPSIRSFVYVLRNTGTTAQPVYDKPALVMAGDKPAETYGFPCSMFADFDGDGDLDLICGEFLDSFTYFENIGTRTAPKYALGRKLATADGQPLKMDLQMITPTAIDWNKDGHMDLVVGEEDGRVSLLLNTGRLSADHMPLFSKPRFFQQEADLVKCGALATPFGFDWDGDGAMDLICGNSAGYIVFFKNLSAPGVEKPEWDAPKYLEADGKVIRVMAGPTGSIQGPVEAKWGYTTLTVADWDGDGLPDLVVNSILGEVVWYRNIGSRQQPKIAAAQSVEVEWDGPQPAWGRRRPVGKALLTQWRTTPVAVDWNRDGLTDLVMLDHEGYLAFFERARCEGKRVLLPPRRIFCNEHGEPLLLSKRSGGASGRRKLCIVDWDGDGKLDILLSSANANFLRQVEARDGKYFFQDMGTLDPQDISQHDVSPAVVDFNEDGIPDYLGGAEDGHLYYLKNPRRGSER